MSGPGKSAERQSLSKPGTSGTSGTTSFAEGAAQADEPRAPAEWHDVLAELERLNCPEWITAERWQDVLSDAENFLSRWGAAAHALGWTALDLYGVHPIAPAARFDVMGLLPLIQGGSVVALTAGTASIRWRSGAALTFRRPQPGAILITEVRT